MRKQSVGASLFVQVVWLTGLTLAASAQGDPAGPLARAESLYVQGEARSALELLVNAEGEISGEHMASYLRLVTLAQLESGAESEAWMTALRLLHVEPAYEPASSDPEAYAALVRTIKDAVSSAGTTVMSCDTELADALASYREGDFEAGEQVLAACLNERLMFLGDADYVPALRLLALLYLKQGDIRRASAAAARLLKLKPEYVPDPVLDPPGYRSLVALLRGR